MGNEPVTPAPAAPAAPMPVTVRMFETLELRVVQLEEEMKAARLELARLKVVPPAPAPAPAPEPAKRKGILRDR